MAKRNQEGSVAHTVMGMPEGFTRGTPELAGAWIKPHEGLIVTGLLTGRYTAKGKKGKERPYYQIKVDKDTPAIVRDAEGEWIDGTVPKDGLVNVDERQALIPMKNLLATGVPHTVWLQFVGKEDLDGGNTWWRIEWAYMPAETAP